MENVKVKGCFEAIAVQVGLIKSITGQTEKEILSEFSEKYIDDGRRKMINSDEKILEGYSNLGNVL